VPFARKAGRRGAKTEEYVKVCSLYGAGYYYMPGSDICLKLGGYVRYQFTAHPGSSISAGPFAPAGNAGLRTNSVDTAHRTRAVITVDTRQQTAYGTLRTYTLLGFQQDSTAAPTTAPTVYMTRGFLQIAGFTFGKATSFFDIYPGASFAYNAGMVYTPDTGDAGQMVAAYTAQFGNGFSATISAEQSRRSTILGPGAGGVFTTPALFTGGAAGLAGNNSLGNGVGTNGYPDLVANLRVDQAWGSVLVGGAITKVGGGYYNVVPLSAHPEDETGFAVTGGFIFNLPMIARGDRFSAQAVYSEGAIKYAAVTPTSNGSAIGRQTDSVGFGYLFDALFTVPAGATAGNLELTTAWSFSAAFEHFWTPALRTSIYGSYIDVSYSGNARAALCAGGGPFGGVGGGNVAGCNPDFSAWNIGSRTQWEPVRGLIMGVDVIYNHLNSARTATGLTTGSFGPVAVSDQSAWTGTFRIQRDFLP
jgi:hypothetical protein